MTATKSKGRAPKTVEDYLKLPDDVRAELIGGEIYRSPSPTSRHQLIVVRLLTALAAFVTPRKLGQVLVSPLDVYLPGGNIVQPDLIFVSTPRLAIVKDWVRGAPDLLVEILSPSNAERDRIVKRKLYAESGVSEYWIVDEPSRSVEVLRLCGKAYEPAGYFEEKDSLTSPTFPGLALPLREIFA